MPNSEVIISSIVEQIESLFCENKEEEAIAIANELRPVELANLVSLLPENRRETIIKNISGLDLLSQFIAHSKENIQKLSISLIDETRISAIIRRLEVDDAVDLLSEFPRRKLTRILKRISAKKAKRLKKLLSYDEETAGGIMTPFFLKTSKNENVSDTISKIITGLKDGTIDETTDISYVYVTNSSELIGVLSLKELMCSDSKDSIENIMHTDVLYVDENEDQEIVARKIADYDFSAIPVVSSDDKKLIGIITVDDVVDVIEDEYTQDLLKLAGTIDDDKIGASAFTALKSRSPWLFASWIGGTFGAMLLGKFSSTIEQLIALTFFMPVVFGMGGNVGSQSSTITVRGLATGELGSFHVSKRIKKETLVGFTLGITFGCLLSIVSYFLFQDSKLSSIVAISISITMTCASLLGASLPVLFNKLGFDPAVSSGPFVTTATDILSIIIYFSIANIFI